MMPVFRVTSIRRRQVAPTVGNLQPEVRLWWRIRQRDSWAKATVPSTAAWSPVWRTGCRQAHRIGGSPVCEYSGWSIWHRDYTSPCLVWEQCRLLRRRCLRRFPWQTCSTA